jgi:PIN domain nuclease of toxin-antitoxin system
MRLLLDTHAFLWVLGNPKKLSKKLTTSIEDPSTNVFVSAASTWEIAIKTALGKLRADLDELVAESRSLGFKDLPVSVAHTLRVRSLPPHHRDPFDRVLVAQAIEDGLTLVTRDPDICRYQVATLWD